MQIISIYNNKSILNGGIRASHTDILNQINLTLIDNCNNQYSSFSDAISQNLTHIDSNELLIIAHQDVIFYDPKSFFAVQDFVNDISKEECYFAGVAGKLHSNNFKEGEGIGNIISGGKETGYKIINTPEFVNTFDECVIITNRNTIERFGLFSDKNIGWHLYAVDACTQLSLKSFKSYVIPLKVNHLSGGACDREFFNTGKYLLKKHKMRYIYTTNGKLDQKSVRLRLYKWIVRNGMEI